MKPHNPTAEVFILDAKPVAQVLGRFHADVRQKLADSLS